MNNNLKSENYDNYNYILIDYNDPTLMWNFAVSVVVFLVLLFFILMNWQPRCTNTKIFDEMISGFDMSSLREI